MFTVQQLFEKKYFETKTYSATKLKDEILYLCIRVDHYVTDPSHTV